METLTKRRLVLAFFMFCFNELLSAGGTCYMYAHQNAHCGHFVVDCSKDAIRTMIALIFLEDFTFEIHKGKVQNKNK